MGKKRGRPNKIKKGENKKYRKIIDNLLIQNTPYDEIESILREDYNFKCTARTIRKYHEDDFNIQKEGNKEYYRRLEEDKSEKESEIDSKKRLKKAANNHADKREKINDKVGWLFENIDWDNLEDDKKLHALNFLLREDREMDKIDPGVNVEVNIENNMDNLSNLFDEDKIRRRLNEKRGNIES